MSDPSGPDPNTTALTLYLLFFFFSIERELSNIRVFIRRKKRRRGKNTNKYPARLLVRAAVVENCLFSVKLYGVNVVEPPGVYF